MQNTRLIKISKTTNIKDKLKCMELDEQSINDIYPYLTSATICLSNIAIHDNEFLKTNMQKLKIHIYFNKFNNVTNTYKMIFNANCIQIEEMIDLLLKETTINYFFHLLNDLKNIFYKMKSIKHEVFNCRRYSLQLNKKTYVMGILNVTPDSFYDGGKYMNRYSALERARKMVKNGADIIEVGGQSFKPGFTQVDVNEEINRVVPIVEQLSKELNVPISVDTCRSKVAKLALEAGCDIINDVYGLQGDKNMAQVVKEFNAGIVIMHNRNKIINHDIMSDILNYIQSSIEIANNFKINNKNIIIDPGLGMTFGKSVEQHFEIIKELEELQVFNLPILLAPSRKTFIGEFLNIPAEERLEATVSTVVQGIRNGVDVIRVHDIKEMVNAIKIADKLIR